VAENSGSRLCFWNKSLSSKPPPLIESQPTSRLSIQRLRNPGHRNFRSRATRARIILPAFPSP
jgi:hypothetical protein